VILIKGKTGSIGIMYIPGTCSKLFNNCKPIEEIILLHDIKYAENYLLFFLTFNCKL